MKQYCVTGMSCAACAARVEKAVSAVPGVTSVSVSLLTNAMGIEGTAHRVSRLEEVIAARVFGTGGLLIVDEAQHLSGAALEGLCRL